MPPKQKQAKKGPAYKQSTPTQSLLPPSQKQPPRECRPIKQPQNYPQIKNTQLQTLLNQFPILFEEWPSQQNVKAMDFGINADNKFEDQYHEQICQFLKAESKEELSWKNFHEIQQLHKTNNVNNQSSDEQVQSPQEKKEQNQEVDNQNPKQQQAPENQQVIQAKDKEMVIIETFMRDETEEEMERRKQQQAEKAAQNAKDKKKGKKQEPKEEGSIQISDVKMEDIKVKDYMCESARWIGSHLQIIKQRQLKDVYTHEPVWKKIYPQENGVPQITKSGRYWVKLYYLGKTIKIEVDDRIPINSNHRQILPVSKKHNQKWTLILAKALIKLFKKASPTKSMVGSGMIVYSLTGMITENISLNGFNDWNKVINLMSDQNYTQKHVIMSAFNYEGEKKSPSNYLKNNKQTEDLLLLQNSTFNNKHKNLDSRMPEQQQQQNMDQEQPPQYLENNILQAYSYCIGDYFQNTAAIPSPDLSPFNMAFSKQRSQIEKNLRKQYSELSKVVLTNKNREQKLEHRRKKKQIKQKLQLQEKKRLELINKKINQYHFVKILGNLQICCEYSHQEILLAKKCMLNGLEKPPNYEIPTDKEINKDANNVVNKQDTKSGISASLVKLNKQDLAHIEINQSLDDFSALEKQRQIKDLLPKNDKGIWIKDQDLLASFDALQIFYNPNSNIFEDNKNIQYVEFKGVNEFSCDENAEVLIIEKKGNPHLQEEGAQQQSNKQEGEKKQQDKIKLLFGFSYQKSKWDTIGKPYCMLQKFDFDSYRTISTVNKLSEIMNSTYLELKNQNTIFKLYTMSKGRYAYWISCSVPYKLLSLSKYLEEYQGYTSKNFTIQYPPLEASNYFPLARIKIKQNNEDNVLIMKFKNTPTFKALEKYLTFKLVSTLDTENSSYTSEAVEGVVEKCSESTYIVSEYTRVELPCQQENKVSYLIISAYLQAQNISDGTLQLEILSKCSNITIDDMLVQQEQIEPYKIVEKYSVNKYATIMKERIYYSNIKDNNISLYFKVVEGQEGQPIAGGGGKGAKKGGKEETVCEIIEKTIEQKKLVHLKIMKNNKILYYARGYNQITIPNLTLQQKNGDNEHQYYIEASFDIREWAEANSVCEETSKIYWVCQIYGDDAIALVKDTKQQQKERETRKSWEDKQPGRAERAKKARLRYLLECRKDKGEELTEEQLQIVNAPKLTRKQLMEQQKKNQDKKGGKGGKKDDKKAGKDKKEEVVEESKEQRPLPKSQDNFMTEIKEFLKNLQQCQVVNEKLEEGEEARIRSAEQQQAIKQGAMMSAQNRVGQLIRNIEMRETLKIRQKDKIDKLKILLEDSRTSFTEVWTKYIQFRIQDKQKDSIIQQKQKSIIDIISTATNPQKTVSISEADMTKMINEYKQIEGFNDKLADVGEMIRKNIKIGNVVQKINTSLAGWEIEQLKNIKEEINQLKIQGIAEDVLKQVHQMLEEAEKNPALVEQKQAELKKGKKGGKK